MVVLTFIALLSMSEKEWPYGEEVETVFSLVMAIFHHHHCFSCRVWVQRWVVRALLQRMVWVSDLPCFVLVFKGRALFR